MRSCITSWILYKYLRLRLVMIIRFDEYSTSSLLIYKLSESDIWSPLICVKKSRKFPSILYVSSSIKIYLHRLPASSMSRLRLSRKLINGSWYKFPRFLPTSTLSIIASVSSVLPVSRIVHSSITGRFFVNMSSNCGPPFFTMIHKLIRLS